MLSLATSSSSSAPFTSKLRPLPATLSQPGRNEGTVSKLPQKNLVKLLERINQRSRRFVCVGENLDLAHLYEDYRNRWFILGLIEGGDETRLRNYLGRLSKEDFRRILVCDIFECLPSAIYGTKIVRKQLSEEQRFWLSEQQRGIYRCGGVGANRALKPLYIKRLYEDYRKRLRILSLIEDGNETQLRIYLGGMSEDGLSKEEFQRILTRDIFEYLPRAIFSIKIVRKRLNEEQRSWLSDQQRDIFNNPWKCKFMGNKHLSRGLEDQEALSSIENDKTMPADSIIDKISAFLYPNQEEYERAAHWDSPSEQEEIHRYLQNCRPHWSAALQRAKEAQA